MPHFGPPPAGGGPFRFWQGAGAGGRESGCRGRGRGAAPAARRAADAGGACVFRRSRNGLRPTVRACGGVRRAGAGQGAGRPQARRRSRRNGRSPFARRDGGRPAAGAFPLQKPAVSALFAFFPYHPARKCAIIYIVLLRRAPQCLQKEQRSCMGIPASAR